MEIFLLENTASFLDCKAAILLASDTRFASESTDHYLSFSGVDNEDMQIAGIAADCKPIAFSAKSDRVNGGEFVASSDLLYHLACFGIKYADLYTFLRSCG